MTVDPVPARAGVAVASHILPRLGPPAVERLAQEVACVIRHGDLVTLGGALGAGKTTFARALIRAMLGDASADVPSPTFTLAQTYEAARSPIAHFDLYRISEPGELSELGLDEALARGIALVEWPERAGDALPPDRLDIRLDDAGAFEGTPHSEAGLRDVAITGHGTWAARAGRLVALHRFVRADGNWAGDDVTIEYLQGDASVRRYARLRRPGSAPAILMDWPRQPDGPPIRDGKPYSRIARLAEDARPYLAIAEALRGAGLRTPAIRAHDCERGLLLIEDFGDAVFGAVLASRTAEADLWRAATDVVVALRRVPVPESLPLPDGAVYSLPLYDREALGIETELLLDWYWPAVHGAPVPDAVRADFLDAWRPVLYRVLVMPRGWVLRDFHSPNLMWLPGETGSNRVGILDFQDALKGPPAYDLVSLLQDARVDVPADIEAALFEHYCAMVTAFEPTFGRDAFSFAYAALGVQRNTKILGIFARLARRDGKPAYLAHIPRLWRYIERNFAHSELSGLRAWYDRHLPPEVRGRSLAE